MIKVKERAGNYAYEKTIIAIITSLSMKIVFPRSVTSNYSVSKVLKFRHIRNRLFFSPNRESGWDTDYKVNCSKICEKFKFRIVKGKLIYKNKHKNCTQYSVYCKLYFNYEGLLIET